MKPESLDAFYSAIGVHADDLYEQGFADGVDSMRMTAHNQDLIDFVIESVYGEQVSDFIEPKDIVRTIIKRLGFGKPPGELPPPKIAEIARIAADEELPL